MAAPSTSLGSGSRFKPKARINSDASSLPNFRFIVNMAEPLEGVIDGDSRGTRSSVTRLGYPCFSRDKQKAVVLVSALAATLDTALTAALAVALAAAALAAALAAATLSAALAAALAATLAAAALVAALVAAT